MTTYVSVMAPCYICHKIFSCNPSHVPSVVRDGTREPVCAACMQQVNAKRVQLGHEPFTIHPHAYDGEPADQVDWND